MATYRTLLVNMEDVRPNMVLAHDVLNTYGRVLIAQDTMLTERLITMLVSYSIENVPIKVFQASAEEDMPDPGEILEKYLPAQTEDVRDLAYLSTFKGSANNLRLNVDSEEFEHFERSYEKKLDEARSCIDDLTSGASVDVQRLYSINSDILNSLKHRNDLFLYMNTLKLSDDFTYTHCLNVSLLCYLFGYWLAFDEQRVANLAIAGMLHDIGKLKLPQEILNKKGPYTPEEQLIVQEHCRYGFDMARKLSLPQDAKMAILMHHERSDGSGYPLGVRGNQINEMSRLVAIADIFDAMTTDRSYRKRLCAFDVIRNLEDNYYGQLDPSLLLMFTKNIAYSYVGSYVRLSTGQVGVIVFINPTDLTRPTVRLHNDVVDLSSRRDIKVSEVL